jgi:asparagine synthase (glutamine-hydrolysing)
MSIQFGRWNLDGRSVDPEYIREAQRVLLPYAPDSITICTKGAFCIVHGAFHTTCESRIDRLPVVSPAGTYLTWTGRLDNRSELLSEFPGIAAAEASDLQIVSSLYERENADSLARLVGDWSLSVMHHYERKLLLAVDFLGASPLYYLRTGSYVAWSSVLEALVLLGDGKFKLSEEYAAGWLFGFPAADLTPYEEIRAVPPGARVEFSLGGMKVRQYWQFHFRNHAKLRSDDEYEEQFRHYFTQAVRRRLRSCGPVLSELSGGLDSSSIVCVADRILEQEPSIAERLDTLSYLDDSEPNWKERPFIREVEAQRGREGFHVDVNMQLSFLPERDSQTFPCTPAIGIAPSSPQQQVSRFLEAQGIRVVLSGMGGDETTGGVPDGSPELADLLVQLRIGAFFQRALAWSLQTRRPLLHTTVDAVRSFVPMSFGEPTLLRKKVPWINARFAARHQDNSACRALQLTVRGGLPSVQENLYTLENLRRQIAYAPLQIHPVRERRYPFLDGDLIEFLYSTPREQLIQPGRRRFLMRRALRGIVPEPVLERKRKAYVARAPVLSIRAQAPELTSWTEEMIASEIGFIDLGRFREALSAAYRGEDTYLWRISRTLELESWLRDPRVQAHVSFGKQEQESPHKLAARNSTRRADRLSPAGQTQPERR